jgi:hypothetical protein
MENRIGFDGGDAADDIGAVYREFWEWRRG